MVDEVVSLARFKRKREKQPPVEELLMHQLTEFGQRAMLLPRDESTVVTKLAPVDFQHDEGKFQGVVLYYSGFDTIMRIRRTIGSGFPNKLLMHKKNDMRAFFVRSEDLYRGRMGKLFEELIRSPIGTCFEGRVLATPSEKFVAENYDSGFTTEQAAFIRLAAGRKSSEIIIPDSSIYISLGTGFEPGNPDWETTPAKYPWAVVEDILDDLVAAYYDFKWKTGDVRYKLVPAHERSEIKNLTPVRTTLHGKPLVGIVADVNTAKDSFGYVFGRHVKANTFYRDGEFASIFVTKPELEKANLYDLIIATMGSPDEYIYDRQETLCPPVDILRERGLSTSYIVPPSQRRRFRGFNRLV